MLPPIFYGLLPSSAKKSEEDWESEWEAQASEVDRSEVDLKGVGWEREEKGKLMLTLRRDSKSALQPKGKGKSILPGTMYQEAETQEEHKLFG